MGTDVGMGVFLNEMCQSTRAASSRSVAVTDGIGDVTKRGDAGTAAGWRSVLAAPYFYVSHPFQNGGTLYE